MNQRPVLGVKLPEFELMRELSLHGNRLSEINHKRVFRGLYHWNCSHEAFFPHACKDGEALWRPPAELAKPAKLAKSAKPRSARRLLQFAWADLTEFEALRAYEEQRQLALRSGDGGGGDWAVCAACAAACAALLTCVALVLALARARRAARRAALQLQGPPEVKLEVSCVL